MDSNKEKFILKTYSLAKEAMETNSGGPFGAIVVLNDRIIGEGKNEVVLRNDPTAHAEINAIRKACESINSFDLSGSTLYTSCEPCPMCLGAIYWSRIQKVVFGSTSIEASEIAGVNDEIFYREMALSWKERTIEHEEHYNSEIVNLFKEWKDKPDKTEY